MDLVTAFILLCTYIYFVKYELIYFSHSKSLLSYTCKSFDLLEGQNFNFLQCVIQMKIYCVWRWLETACCAKQFYNTFSLRITIRPEVLFLDRLQNNVAFFFPKDSKYESVTKYNRYNYLTYTYIKWNALENK